MMKERKSRNLLRSVAFFVILAMLLTLCSWVMERKSLNFPHNDTVKIGGLKNEPDHSLDVMFFGSSHTYCTVNPLVLWEKEGIASYVFSSPGQMVYATYHYIKEALKTQSPQVVALELYMTTFEKEYPEEMGAHDAIDPIPPSLNKFQLIQTAATPETRSHHYANLIRYHSRWKELTRQDFDLSFRKQVDPFRGFAPITERGDHLVQSGVYERAQPSPVYEKNMEYLRKIVQLSKERDFKLLFFVAPFSPNEREAGVFKTLDQFAAQHQIPMLDMNLMYQELDLYQAGLFCDDNHLNYLGADRVSTYLTQYLKEHYSLPDRRGEADYAVWNDYLQQYKDYVNS